MNDHYQHTHDFLNDDSFVQWVLFGRNKAVWLRYQMENPDKKVGMDEARRLLLDIHAAERKDIPDLNQQLVWTKIKAGIQSPTEERKAPLPTRLIPSTWAMAAAMMLVLGMGWLVWQQQPADKVRYRELTAEVIEKSKVIEKTAAAEDSLKIELEDGSVIILGRNSRLSYPEHFDSDRRTVVLTGEAFFDIAKDRSRPFYIYSNEVITKVLGTSFRIKAFDSDSQVLVQVKTGRVSVFSKKRRPLTDPETDGLVLLPNQQAIYSRDLKSLSRRLVEIPLPVVASPESIPARYDEVPVSTILRDIQAQYGITVLFNDDVLDRCVITTTLGNESLYDKLDLICQTIGASYKEVDAQLIVESKGCR
jgi:transmembrane sensor